MIWLVLTVILGIGAIAGRLFSPGPWRVVAPVLAVGAWVILTIIYAVLLVIYQAYAAIVLHNPWELPPIVFGLLAGLLVAALYPIAPRRPQPRPAMAPAAPPAMPAAPKPAAPAPAEPAPKATEGGKET